MTTLRSAHNFTTAELAAIPWRLGTKNPRNMYGVLPDGGEVDLGKAETEGLGALIVGAVNGDDLASRKALLGLRAQWATKRERLTEILPAVEQTRALDRRRARLSMLEDCIRDVDAVLAGLPPAGEGGGL